MLAMRRQEINTVLNDMLKVEANYPPESKQDQDHDRRRHKISNADMIPSNHKGNSANLPGIVKTLRKPPTLNIRFPRENNIITRRRSGSDDNPSLIFQNRLVSNTKSPSKQSRVTTKSPLMSKSVKY